MPWIKPIDSWLSVLNVQCQRKGLPESVHPAAMMLGPKSESQLYEYHKVLKYLILNVLQS